MKKQTRDRLVLPVLLPVGILVVIAGVLYGFSRVLLSISPNAATAVALVVALAIVVVAGVVAARQHVRVSSLIGMIGAVAGVAMLAGGFALATIGTGEGGGGGGEVTTVQVVAANIAFQPTSLSVTAGQAFNIAFDNQDAGVQHNIQIFDNPDFSGAPVFDGQLVTGPAKVVYEVPPLAAGMYAFRCVVHPNMTGTIEATEGGGGGGGVAGPTVTAQNIAFDTDTIELPADTAVTLTFDNQDAGVQHNISIYEDDSAATNLFKGDLVTGVASAEYQIPPLPAGEYYFRCDVHPNMNGKVVVSGGSPMPSGTASPATPTPSPSDNPMPSMSGTAAPTPSGGNGGTTTAVMAQGVAFDTAEIVLPAGQPSTITFTNNDAGVQHNIVIATDSSLSDILFQGDLVTGVATVEYQVPALDAGSYYFACVVHPNMNGIVTVR